VKSLESVLTLNLNPLKEIGMELVVTVTILLNLLEMKEDYNALSNLIWTNCLPNIMNTSHCMEMEMKRD